jgi:fructose-specific phosphotransferase system component IIB
MFKLLKQTTFIGFMTYILLFLVTNTVFAADFFIKSLKAPLLEEAKTSSKVKASLDRGTQVVGAGSDGSFIKVTSQGQQGFVNKLFLSDKPIQDKSSLLNQDVDISSKARKRASGFTSAAAARGLKEDSDDIFKSLTDADADPDAVKQMESLVVTDVLGISFLMDSSMKLTKETK